MIFTYNNLVVKLLLLVLYKYHNKFKKKDDELNCL